MKKVTTAIILNLILLMLSFKINDDNAGVSQAQLIQWYKDYYLASAIDSMPWSGNIKNCVPGTLPLEIIEKAEKRVNFFRLVNGLPLIEMEPDSAQFPQAAALMMLANDKLSHLPAKTWKCYSAHGVKGAAASCLGLCNQTEYTDSDFVTGFIDDIGESNSYVGHRRWLLYSKIKRFSYGATTCSEAIYAIMNDFRTEKPDVDFIAYPWQGYVPHNLVFAKWSFAIPEANKVDFSGAKVTVLNEEGKQLNIRMYPYKRFLDPTLVWFMEDLFTLAESDYGENMLDERGFVGQTLTVNINNVITNGVLRDYNYQVTITDLDYLQK